MNAFLHATLPLAAALLTGAASAQPADHRLGEHPAVIVKRLSATPSYDYASKFYPHPAWLYLHAEPPRTAAPDEAALSAAACRPAAAGARAAPRGRGCSRTPS